LHFADVRKAPHDASRISVKLNGESAIENLALAAPTDATWQPVVKEIRNVRIEKDLVIDLDATEGTAVLNAVEAIRE
jgi:hypothetical protein